VNTPYIDNVISLVSGRDSKPEDTLKIFFFNFKIKQNFKIIIEKCLLPKTTILTLRRKNQINLWIELFILFLNCS